MAATPAEALAKLDEHQFELVLSDGRFGSSNEGRNVLAYARVKSYQPATALITSARAFAPPSARTAEFLRVHRKPTGLPDQSCGIDRPEGYSKISALATSGLGSLTLSAAHSIAILLTYLSFPCKEF